MNTLFSTAFRFIFYLVLFILFLSLWGYYSATHPLRFYSQNTPAEYGVPFETITLTTKDNINLSAWYVPAKIKTNKAIIMLHGYGADKGNILPGRIYLRTQYNLLFIDFRYFGESEGSYSTAGLEETEDLNAAVTYLKKKGIKKIGVWGLSMGGSVAIMAAESNKNIDAIVAESPYASLSMMADDYVKLPGINVVVGKIMRWWGLLFLGKDLNDVSPQESIKGVTQPILLIHSKNDYQISYRNAELLQMNARENPRFETLILNDAPHGWLDRSIQLRVKTFFEKALGE